MSTSAFDTPAKAGSLLASLAWSFAAFGRAYRAHLAMRELMALDDRTLRDLGLGRSQIEQVVWSGRSRF